MVICKLPKAGLGNQLFPLLKAFIFAELNNLPVIVTGYNRLKIGPYLRGEKNKRNYNNYFRFQKNILLELVDKIKVAQCKGANLIHEPSLGKQVHNPNNCYSFTEIPHWSDYFEALKPHRDLVLQLFSRIVSPEILKEVDRSRIPCIGVHIRMGDFRKLREGEDFKKVGAVRTPEQYFVQVIQEIRRINGTTLPVTIFSDGDRSELPQIMELPAVEMMTGNSDLADLIILSRSKVIITSAGSSFSYWAAFLSNAPVILHPDHIHKSIRPAERASEMYEGPSSADASLLIDNIRSIQ